MQTSMNIPDWVCVCRLRMPHAINETLKRMDANQASRHSHRRNIFHCQNDLLKSFHRDNKINSVCHFLLCFSPLTWIYYIHIHSFPFNGIVAARLYATSSPRIPIACGIHFCNIYPFCQQQISDNVLRRPNEEESGKVARQERTSYSLAFHADSIFPEYQINFSCFVLNQKQHFSYSFLFFSLLPFVLASISLSHSLHLSVNIFSQCTGGDKNPAHMSTE